MKRVALRFDARDARLLRALEVRVRNGEYGEQHVATFREAAVAAETGEPLIVICENHLEAVAMADGYTQFGVRRPAVDELTGMRPSR